MISVIEVDSDFDLIDIHTYDRRWGGRDFIPCTISAMFSVFFYEEDYKLVVF